MREQAAAWGPSCLVKLQLSSPSTLTVNALISHQNRETSGRRNQKKRPRRVVYTKKNPSPFEQTGPTAGRRAHEEGVDSSAPRTNSSARATGLIREPDQADMASRGLTMKSPEI